MQCVCESMSVRERMWRVCACLCVSVSMCSCEHVCEHMQCVHVCV